MKSPRLIIFAIPFILLIVSPIVLNQYYNYLLQPVQKEAQEINFIIAPNQPVAQIAQNLEEKNVIKNALAFRLLVNQMGIGKNIQAGDFHLSPAQSSRQIAEELTHGAIDIWITIPEGFRREEIAARVESKLKSKDNEKYQFNKEEFVRLAKEGYMYPDTYLIAVDATAKDVAARLEQTFNEKIDAKLIEKAATYNLTKDELITLASLIEREAKTNEEKPIIAGIIMNRLKANIALQIDATIQYAKGYDTAKNTWWPPISMEEYQNVKSPYNTYLYPGLPPTPIANPGIESIRAAANPKDTPYLYYLHDSNGKIHYASSLEEHNRNIQKYL